jgi:hypothetical protein
MFVKRSANPSDSATATIISRENSTYMAKIVKNCQLGHKLLPEKTKKKKTKKILFIPLSSSIFRHPIFSIPVLWLSQIKHAVIIYMNDVFLEVAWHFGSCSYLVQ